jgi:hypothetical protein
MTLFLTIAALIAALVRQAFPWKPVLCSPDDRNRRFSDLGLRIESKKATDSTSVDDVRANTSPCANESEPLKAQSDFPAANGFHRLPVFDSGNAGGAETRPAKLKYAEHVYSKNLKTLDTAFRTEMVCRCCTSVYETFRLQKHKSRPVQAAFANLNRRGLMRSCSFGS